MNKDWIKKTLLDEDMKLLDYKMIMTQDNELRTFIVF